MKIKSIAGLCKKSRTIILINVPNGEAYRQWIGDGHSMYPIVGLPFLHKEEIFTLFEIKEEDQSKYYFDEEEQDGSFYEDTNSDERLINTEKLRIATADAIIRPVQTSRGIAFFDTKYLGPLAELVNMELYERYTESGTLHFVAKSGFLLYGIIMPYQVITEEFTDTMLRIAKLCRSELIKRGINEEENIQVAIDTDTGEITEEENA